MKIELSSAIPTIVESFLPRFSDKRLGLLFEIDASFNNYTKNDEDYNRREYLQMLIIRPDNYTKVLFRKVTFVDGGYHVMVKKPITWKKLSDHDSCWRTDGMRCFFQYKCEVWKWFEERGIARDDILEHISFSIFNQPKYVEISQMKGINTPDGCSESYSPDWEVVIERQIPLNEVHNYLPEK